MNETDVGERNRIYAEFVATGRPPGDVDEGVLRRLDNAHALVLEGNTLSIRM